MDGVINKKAGYQFGWLDSPQYDLTLIAGVFFLAIASGLIVAVNPDLFGIVLVLDIWLLGYHHVIATFTKLAGTQEDRKQNWFLIYPLPLFVLVFVAGLATFVGVWAIATVYLFWQWYHYTRQSWGISAFYKRKAGIKPKPGDHYIGQAVFWAVPLWGILHRCAQGWDEFLFLPVWVPPVPMVLADGVGALACLLVLYWVYEQYKSYKAGTLSVGLTAFMVSHFAIFYVGYIAIEHINYGWLAINVWHNAQYILFVWLYNTNRFKHVDMDNKSILAWASQKTPVRILAYFALCLFVTTIFYKSITGFLQIAFIDNQVLFMTLLIVAFQTINFHHYVVDSMIWKARSKKHQKVMRIEQ